MKSLGWAVAIAMLAITGAMAGEEPGAIANYKKAVSSAITAWDSTMDTHQDHLRSAIEDWHAARRSIAQAARAKDDAEKDRQKLESDRRALEKKLSDLQKDASKQPMGKATGHGADIALINKIKDEIKKTTDEMNKKTAEVKKAEEFKKKVEDDLPNLRQKIADEEADMAPLKGVIENITTIPSPANDEAAVRDKSDLGPELQHWIQDQLNAKTQKWTAAPVVVTVEWPQDKFEHRYGPKVVADIKRPRFDHKQHAD